MEKAIHPIQNMEPFDNNGWLPDGNINWIDTAYPDDIQTGFPSVDNR